MSSRKSLRRAASFKGGKSLLRLSMRRSSPPQDENGDGLSELSFTEKRSSLKRKLRRSTTGSGKALLALMAAAKRERHGVVPVTNFEHQARSVLREAALAVAEACTSATWDVIVEKAALVAQLAKKEPQTEESEPPPAPASTRLSSSRLSRGALMARAATQTLVRLRPVELPPTSPDDLAVKLDAGANADAETTTEPSVHRGRATSWTEGVRMPGSPANLSPWGRLRRKQAESGPQGGSPLARSSPASTVSPLRVQETTLYDAATSTVDGFLIDLDGTMYQPDGLIPGAKAFYRWLIESGKPYVFLSNTGAKNSRGVQAKFASRDYLLDPARPVPLEHIFTAAEAQADCMLQHVPPHAKILVIAGGSGVWREDLRARGGAAGAALYATWDIRTALTDDEAKEWAACAACSKKTKLVWVAFFTDGEISGHAPASSADAAFAAAAAAATAAAATATDGCVGAAKPHEGFSDWGFEVIKTAGFLLSHGAQFIHTADDAYNPSADAKHPGMMFPLPGPGMFAEMMKKLMYPHGKENVWCPGKGGNVGGEYMMEQAIRMLIEQGHSGDRSRIMMVGDRFDTDIRAGNGVGIRTCLVTSGCHSLGCQRFYRMDPAHHHAPSVMHLTTYDERAVAAATAPAEAAGPGELLRAWSLSQGNILRPIDAVAGDASLRPRLRGYFASADIDGNGRIDPQELLRALSLLGLSARHTRAVLLRPPTASSTESDPGGGMSEATRRKLQRMLATSAGGALAASPAAAPDPADPVDAADPADSADSAGPAEPAAADDATLDCDEFCDVIEAALNACGVATPAHKSWVASKDVFGASRYMEAQARVKRELAISGPEQRCRTEQVGDMTAKSGPVPDPVALAVP